MDEGRRHGGHRGGRGRRRRLGDQRPRGRPGAGRLRIARRARGRRTPPAPARPGEAPRAMSGALQTSGEPAPRAGRVRRRRCGPGGRDAPGRGRGRDGDAHGSRSPAAALDPASLTAPATAATTRAGVPLDASADGPVKSLLDRVVGDRGGPRAPRVATARELRRRQRPRARSRCCAVAGCSRVLSGGSASGRGRPPPSRQRRPRRRRRRRRRPHASATGVSPVLRSGRRADRGWR